MSPASFPCTPLVTFPVTVTLFSFFSFASFVRQPVAVIVCPVIFALGLFLDSAQGVKPNASAKPSAPVRIAVADLCFMTRSRSPPISVHILFRSASLSKKRLSGSPYTHAIFRNDVYRRNMKSVVAVLLLLGGVVQAQEPKAFVLKSRIELSSVNG